MCEECCGPVGLFKYLKWREKRRVNQYIMAVLIYSPVVTMAFVTGWLSPSLPNLVAEDGPLDHPASEEQISWIASIGFLLSFPAMLVSGCLADTFGRQKCVLIPNFCIATCWVIKITWSTSSALMLGRAIAGFGSGIAYVVTVFYVKEISDEDIRGSLVTLYILSQNAGIIMVYVLGDILSYRALLWTSLSLPVFHLVLFINAPDSPAYLIKKGRKKDATIVLAWLKSTSLEDEDVAKVIQAMSVDPTIIVKGSQLSKMRFIFSDRKTLRAYFICATTVILQEFSGYLILLTYASHVFEMANVVNDLSANKQTVIVGCFQMIGSCFAFFLIEKIGRKILLIATSFLCGIGMLGLSISFFVISQGESCPAWLPILSMSTSIFFTAAGYQPTPYVLLAEMFTFQVRGVVTSSIVALTAISDFLQTRYYQYLIKSIGAHGTFTLFTIICFTSTAFTVFFIPETRNKSIEEIYASFTKRKRDNLTNASEGASTRPVDQ